MCNLYRKNDYHKEEYNVTTTTTITTINQHDCLYAALLLLLTEIYVYTFLNFL